MNEFEVYKLYMALKLHFTSPKYDFFKYNGKVNSTVEAFNSRKDKYKFIKLAKHSNPIDVMVANLSEDPECWIGDMLSEENMDKYYDYAKNKESMFRVFTLDLKNFGDDFNKCVSVPEDKGIPPLFKLYQRRKVSKNTMIIIDRLCKVFDIWKKEVEEDFIFPNELHKLEKLSPFISVETDKYRQEILKQFS